MPDLRLIDISALPCYMATPKDGDGYVLVVPRACLVDAPRADAECITYDNQKLLKGVNRHDQP